MNDLGLMNCIEFQRELNANPRRLGGAARAHAEDCATCARRMVRQLNREDDLSDALAIPVPDGLEDRVLLAARMEGRRGARRYALAASVLLAVAVLLALPLRDPAPDLLAIAAGHVVGEPQHLAETNAQAPRRVASLLALAGARLEQALPVTYANDCELPDARGHMAPGGHIVIETVHGRVALMLMPHGKTETSQRRKQAGMWVELHPAARGSYALVAPTEAALDAARALVGARVRWA
jgi:hypothetical protein